MRSSFDLRANPATPGRWPRPWLLAVIALAVTHTAGGCVDDNPDYCADDRACQRRADADPTVGRLCHPLGHFCYDGCQRDADCRDPAAPGYRSDRLHCDPVSRHCASVPSPVMDAGGDAVGETAPGKKNGASCGAAVDCESGFCSPGGVCCDRACDGACEMCPTGSCEPRPAGFACAETTCEQGLLTEHRCTADGACTARDTSCGGYACTASGAACRDSCSEDGDARCVGTYECIDGECHNTLPDGEPCGTNNLACKSRHCVDGVCCATAGCPDCFGCDLPGQAGTCQPREQGPAPPGECPGDSHCGAGLCDGTHGCAYLPPGTPCSQPSCSGGGTAPHIRVVSCCDGQGGCSQIDQQSCGFARCVGGECLDGCAEHVDCMTASLCDRSAAHADPQGRGECIDPAQVVALQSGETLAAAVARTDAGRTYVRVPVGVHGAVSVAARTVRLIGDGTLPEQVVIHPAAGVPAARVEGQGTLLLQGVQLQGATSAAAGVQCSAGSKLALIDSVVTANDGVGVDAANCEVTLRRNRIWLKNSGGGVRLVSGSAVVESNLVASNGVPAISSFGGLWLELDASSLVWTNNTVANNVAQAGVAGGVVCNAPAPTLHNAIVWGNSDDQTAGCALSHSNVEGGAPPGSGNLSLQPLFTKVVDGDYTLQSSSPSIDAGDSGAPGIGSIDLARAPRIHGGQIDQGALEAQ